MSRWCYSACLAVCLLLALLCVPAQAALTAAQAVGTYEGGKSGKVTVRALPGNQIEVFIDMPFKPRFSGGLAPVAFGVTIPFSGGRAVAGLPEGKGKLLLRFRPGRVCLSPIGHALKNVDVGFGLTKSGRMRSGCLRKTGSQAPPTTPVLQAPPGVLP